MKLIHFTEKKFNYDPFFVHPQIKDGKISTNPDNRFKPAGLWLSDEDEFGWKEWCEGEQFRMECFEYAYQITLHDNNNVLFLRDENDLADLNRKYRSPESEVVNWVNWNKVMEDFDGIVISPYQWSLRLESQFFWYYGWDCAGGCIWNPVFDLKEILHAV